MNFLKWLIIVVFLIGGIVDAQELKTITRCDGLFKEVYSVLKNDTNQRHGKFLSYYKGKLIEKGAYKNGEQYGRWKYYNLDNILEYEYDYNRQKIVYISGENWKRLDENTPCLFRGSPLIPYLFMVEHLSYPQKARDMDVQGKVVLALRVNEKGQVYGFYLYERLHPLIDRAVIDVAKTMPDDWIFLSATKRGVAIPSEYHIAIEFELETKN